MEISKQSTIGEIQSFYGFCKLMCKVVQESENIANGLLAYPEDFKFDLVISDYSVGPCLLGVIKHFNYPPVVFCFLKFESHDIKL
jgi:glucuronosyltransferase